MTAETSGAAAFQRARTEEQRAERREAILATAREMLDGARVAELSLNELARQVGLAKSNVLRYFESREAVLLELYDREYRAWLDELAGRLASVPRPAPANAEATIEIVAAALAETVAHRRVFCELSASAPSVLEHNVSADVAAEYKRTTIANSNRLVGIVAPLVGGLPGLAAVTFVGGVTIAIGGVWSMSQPSPGMAAAYAAHPELQALRLDLRVAVRELVATLLTGLRHRRTALSEDGSDGAAGLIGE
ncbi:TetR/AcrR family transcriptional regulator [Compostimonas suwonensis]|uniref:AcrR family transcriptional regulator n=1 Tax=Compostimonas suwonensis TaxID=1048394 RepID=A0A2M9BW27_9MICO|nr:TetR family transcriptional regulator [Compostimonas suwonensis]PJJ62162.1 AcrR family transcriptional regulator [Compostimonas suwonensis]